MHLPPGTRIGVYEIVDALGAGGMGEVYRARDARLNRDVAIKILPPLFAADPERLARFEREAQVLASLNHPNIAQIYGVEDPSADQGRALVMELVEGEDLAVHIARSGGAGLPLHECLSIARQIADALDCAHEQGIIHRDLKPANVKVREDGTVKVLDFGLAKLADPVSGSSPSVMLSPTITSPATQLGVILGTAAYMAPEQARGKAVDKRADVWAFGLVVYEMLTGRRAFEGSEVSDTLAFILTKDPDWSALPEGTPAPIKRLLRRCLHKDRKQRLADMSDARLELEESLAPAEREQPQPAAVPVARSRWFVPAVVAAVAVAAVIGGVAATTFFRTPSSPSRVMRFTVPLVDGVEFTNPGRHVVAISPDGGRVAFVANRQVYVRSVESTTAEAIPGSGSTGSVIGVTFSPDGQYLAYFAEGALRRIAITGGTPVTLAPVRNPLGVHWTPGGIFVGQGPDGIVRIPPDGGQPEPVVKVAAGEFAQGPQLLPGGDWLMFTLAAGEGETRWDRGKVVALSLRSGERKVLLEGGADARHVSTGHVLYATSGVVFAVPFDLASMTVKGAARPVIEGVRRSAITGAAHYAVSPAGMLAYVPGPAVTGGGERYLAFLDWSGALSRLDLPGGDYEAPRASPDGTRIAFGSTRDTDADIWIYELSGKSAPRRLTFGGRNRFPLWSPDGQRIVFQSNREGDSGLYVQSADVSGAASRLTKADGAGHVPTSWSPDGQWLAFTVAGNEPAISMLSTKDKTVQPFRPAAGESMRTAGGIFSPDGRWFAYHGSSPGVDPLVFVEPFPANGARYQIREGVHSMWMPGGRELLVGPFGTDFVVFNVKVEPRFAFSETARIRRDTTVGTPPAGARNYDVMPDGKRMLVIERESGTAAESRAIQIVVNWFEELKNLR